MKISLLLLIGTAVFATVPMAEKPLQSRQRATPMPNINLPNAAPSPVDSPTNRDREGDFYTDPNRNPIDLRDPVHIRQNIEYDPVTGEMIITERIGDFHFRRPNYISFEDFLEMENQRLNEEYWRQRSEGVDLLGRSEEIKLETGSELLERFLGGAQVEIRPRGNIELIFGGRFQNIENPTLPERARKQGNFDFDMNINMNVTGQIGDKMKLNTNYNTQATFDFDNQINLGYEGTEDEIVQEVAAGNVNFNLPTTLIQGSSSLFGLKSKLKFGRLTVTTVLSQQRSKRENIVIEGGAQLRQFEIKADKYDENRHFFLGHFFRDNYENHLRTMPVVNSPVMITRIEVWVTNSSGATQNARDVVGFMDLGETEKLYNQNFVVAPGPPIPHNGANDLYSRLNNTQGARNLNTSINSIQSSLGLQPIQDFEKVRARKLTETEYTLHPQLGYISLNQMLQPAEVLAVAYEYTYQGQTYRVGEFTQDMPIDPNAQNMLFLKMLKSTSARPMLPIWHLMMKNIYALGAYQVSNEDFRLDVYYQDPGGGDKRYIPEGEGIKSRPLIRVLNLDRLNNQGDPQPDGIFDYVPGITINPQNGRLIFPVVEPFGSHLRGEFEAHGNPTNLADKYTYQLLYDSTRIVAEQFPQFNRFVIKGSYKSSVSSEIYLGAFNIPRGSVTISAGGQQLREGQDYTIDYNLGRVRIINEGIMNSGMPINVSYENNATFGFIVRTMIGNRLDYWINDNFTIGVTHMRLSERPFTQKVNYGDDPIANNIYGADFGYRTDWPGLTRALNLLPFYQSEATSSFNIMAEGAYLKPGHSRAINQNKEDKGGYVYIDDFEGTRTAYDLRFPLWSWALASTPHGARDENGTELFTESKLFDSLEYGYNRAKLIWYHLDPVFQSNNSATPQYIKDNPSTQSNHYVRIINEREIFERDNPNLLFTQISTFDMAYYPSMRGPYNYLASANGIPGKVAGLNPDGSLKRPETRWGGISRAIQFNDFEQANVEYIDFWIMDPFDNTQPYGNVNGSGYLYINLGNVSEDVLKDSRMFFENGLPRPGTNPRIDSTAWGIVPRTQVVVNAFDTDPDVLRSQDVGFDGLSSEQERDFFSGFLAEIDQMVANGELDPAIRDQLYQDPSSDDFIDYLADELKDQPLDILQRYLSFDGTEGNTAANIDNNQFSHGSNLPNSEDLNGDNTLNEVEEYFEYRIPIFAGMDVQNNPYITDVVTYNAQMRDGTSDEVNWYHFQIPIREYTGRVGGIPDFRSIRFVRMFMTGFEQPVILRFAQLQLVRNQWMRYRFSLQTPGEYIPNDNESTTLFNVGAVNIEENSRKQPIPYMLPPGIQREQFIGNNTGQTFMQNEQSLLLQVCGLQDGDSRAVFKTLNFDFRQYERMQLFIHAASYTGGAFAAPPLNDGEMYAFLRVGDDFSENYYEYAIPLKVTRPEDVTGTEDQRREAIWPKANLMDVLLDSLLEAKRQRNAQALDPTIPYSMDIGDGHIITVIGNPNLGSVKVAMIGLRNPKDEGVIGADLCAEVWANEFRLYGLNEDGGGAGLVRTDLRLADLGTLSLAASFHTIGFGQLEQKVDQRYRDNFFQFDASANLELGKLLPEKLGIRLPMFAGISNSYSRPEFDPYDFDLSVKEKASLLEGASRQEYLKQVQDFTSIRSLNFTNMRKDKTGGGKARMWDISNFNFTYAYNEIYKTSPILDYDLITRTKYGMAYNFSRQVKYIEPFKKMFGKSQWLRIVKDFNINPLPNRLSFRTEMNRQYGETVMRDLYGDALLDTTYNKFFTWDRFYDVRWDLTKSLKLDFTATNLSRIDEPDGRIDTKEKRDSVWTNIRNLGRNTNYRHSITANYTLPTTKLPITDWINARAAYSVDYIWMAASLAADTLGNTISNTRNIRLNADGNLTRLYNKVDILKKANAPPPRRPPTQPGRPGVPPPRQPPPQQQQGGSEMHPALKGTIRLFTALKRVSANYTRSEGTQLPGFMPVNQFMGLDKDWGAPGWPFVVGYQPDSNYLNRMAARGYMTRAETFNFMTMQNLQENIDIRATFEPVPDMRIELTWKQSYTEGFSEFFRFDPIQGRFVHQNPMYTGNFTTTFVGLRTIFDKVDSSYSGSYRNFEGFRPSISNTLGELNPYSTGTFFEPNPFDTLIYPNYADGYGPYSIDVLIPSFMAAYLGVDPSEVNRDLFKTKPLPNWRVTYNGLSKIAPLDKIFQSINIQHGYTATLTVNSFISDYNYRDTSRMGFPSARDSMSGNFYPFYSIPQIMLMEQFSPLIGFDMTMLNGLTARVEYKRARTAMLNVVDYQVIETSSAEFTIGAGYRIKGMKLPFKVQGKETRLDNDLNFKFDFSLRNDITRNYVIDQETGGEATMGARTYSISPSVDYVINERLNIRLFFDRRRTRPWTSASYPITNTNAGIAVRFTLAE